MILLASILIGDLCKSHGFSLIVKEGQLLYVLICALQLRCNTAKA